MLIRTALNDSQVMYWEPAKYVARLRTMQSNDAPVLLETNMGAGHGGASGRYDRLHEVALDYAFMLWQMEAATEDHVAGPASAEPSAGPRGRAPTDPPRPLGP
jgi:oligopeptidase B